MIKPKTFGFVKWNQDFHQELLMFRFEWECKPIDYAVMKRRMNKVLHAINEKVNVNNELHNQVFKEGNEW